MSGGSNPVHVSPLKCCAQIAAVPASECQPPPHAIDMLFGRHETTMTIDQDRHRSLLRAAVPSVIFRDTTAATCGSNCAVES